jgi:uncharacterized protein (TIGR02679 family)
MADIGGSTRRPPEPVTAGAVTRLTRLSLAPLVDELARRFSAGDTPVTVTLRDLPLATRQSLADLLGSDRVPPACTRLRMDRLVEALGVGSVGNLRSAIEALRGPLANRRAERQANRAARESLWSWLADEMSTLRLGGDPDGLAPWVAEQRLTGVRGGIDVHRRRLEAAVRVLQSLPADGSSLSGLANDCAGDPHALDHGRSLSGLVLDAVALWLGRPRPTDAEAARTLWETAGVVPDPNSSTVLTFGLPGGDDSPLQRWMTVAADLMEPVVLSLSNLRRWPLSPLPAGSTLFVVENPSLIAEATTIRAWSHERARPPLVCSSGRPTIATVTLLRQLGAAGATLYQHADFDPAGLAITAWLAERAGTIPWGMTSSQYLTWRPAPGPSFNGTVPPTPWDPGLQVILERERVALYEEEIRTHLLQSMASRVGF